MEICDVFSDHMPVLFEAAFSHAAVKSGDPIRSRRILNSITANQFCAAFNHLSVPSGLTSATTEELCTWFHSSCLTILDSVAPSKTVQPKAKPAPWFNARTRTARRECRKAERRWKKDKLRVSYQILKDCWRCYQSNVEEARREHLSNLIESNCHNPRVLFKTIESVLNPPQQVCTEASPETCNSLLHFFYDKVATARALISTPASDTSGPAPCLAVFEKFEPLSLTALEDVVDQIKPSGSPCDSVPSPTRFSLV